MKFIIPGPPQPLKRHRHTLSGINYNPQKQLMLDLSFLIKSQHKSPQLTGPLSLKITFFMPIPKSLSNKKKFNLVNTPHHCKADLDNLLKFILDILNYSQIIHDDAQFSEIHAVKLYSDNPRTEFELFNF